jgi:hypothetical protein
VVEAVVEILLGAEELEVLLPLFLVVLLQVQYQFVEQQVILSQ